MVYIVSAPALCFTYDFCLRQPNANFVSNFAQNYLRVSQRVSNQNTEARKKLEDPITKSKIFFRSVQFEPYNKLSMRGFLFLFLESLISFQNHPPFPVFCLFSLKLPHN
jgi:hypothetical protein